MGYLPPAIIQAGAYFKERRNTQKLCGLLDVYEQRNDEIFNVPPILDFTGKA